jgi:hypothetical protein
MVSFYDPRNIADQKNVEQILKMRGVEYATRRETAPGFGPLQIMVAEEDLPQAEEILLSR